MPENEAQGWFHQFVSSVYWMPFFGAILSDGWLGKYRTIFYLSIVYCLGHFTLALMDTSFGIAFGQKWVLGDRTDPDRARRRRNQTLRLRERRRPIRRIEPASARTRFWLVLFFHQSRLLLFHLALSGSASQSELGTALGLWACPAS